MLSRPPDTATAARGDGSRTLELSQTTLPTFTGSLVNNRESVTRLKASLVSFETMVSARSPFTVVPLFLNFFLSFSLRMDPGTKFVDHPKKHQPGRK